MGMAQAAVKETADSRSPEQIFEDDLHDWVALCYDDPLSFVMGAYPWPVNGQPGPDDWQIEELEYIGECVKENGFDGLKTVMPIRRAISSGHGIGKDALLAWIVDWIMSTRRDAQGTITANSDTQLQTKTWAAIRAWTKMCLTGHWFEVNSSIMYRRGHRETWFCTPQTSREENSEAFAGQHKLGSTSFYGFSEASAIHREVWKVAEGGLTDGEPMIFVLGNPTRNEGEFYQACFGSGVKRWNPRIIDSRTCKLPNKDLIKEWEEDYGVDSDFFRVRVRGLPPRAADTQFIDQPRIFDAQKRTVIVTDDEPLICGCDLAWGGADDNVIRFRRGRDARSIPSISIKGEFTRNPQVLTTRLAEILDKTYGDQKVAMLFLDSSGIAGPIGANLRALGHHNFIEVNFGADSPEPKKQRFMRDYMWDKAKQWLLEGAIDKHLKLEQDLMAPGVRPDNEQRIWLESKKDIKKRTGTSPDHGDALALTFAAKVGKAKIVKRPPKRDKFAGRGSQGGARLGWMS